MKMECKNSSSPGMILMVFVILPKYFKKKHANELKSFLKVILYLQNLVMQIIQNIEKTVENNIKLINSFNPCSSSGH